MKYALTLFIVVAVSIFSAQSFAGKEPSTTYTVVCGNHEITYEVVVNEDKTLLRTEITQFIKINNGNRIAGKMVARMALNSELMRLVLKPDTKVYGDTTTYKRLAKIKYGSVINGDYAVIDLNNVLVNGERIDIDELLENVKKIGVK